MEHGNQIQAVDYVQNFKVLSYNNYCMIVKAIANHRYQCDTKQIICDHADSSNTVTDSKLDPFVTLNYSLPSVPGHPPMPILYTTAALIAVVLCTLAGVITGCLFKLTLYAGRKEV